MTLDSVNCMDIFEDQWKQAIYEESFYAFEHTDFDCEGCLEEALEDWT